MMAVRRPAVAGQFYPADRAALRDMLRGLYEQGGGMAGSRSAYPACVSPHAGYQYSGAVAAGVYRVMDIPSRCVILGPNHTGRGPKASVMARGCWTTPLGDVPLDEALTERLLRRCPWLTADTEAHRAEHSIEVQLPFLQYLQPVLSLVPVVLYPIGLEGYQALGEALAETIREDGIPTLLIASSDFTHYERQADAERKDRLAIEAVEAMDAGELCRRVEHHSISMCGYAPTSVVLAAARRLGCSRGRLLSYQTSGDTTGDYASVVGYAGLAFS